MGRRSDDAVKLGAVLDYNGKTQAEVAALLGVSRTMLSAWVNGGRPFYGALASVTLKRLLDTPDWKDLPANYGKPVEPAPAPIHTNVAYEATAELQALRTDIQVLHLEIAKIKEQQKRLQTSNATSHARSKRIETELGIKPYFQSPTNGAT